MRHVNEFEYELVKGGVVVPVRVVIDYRDVGAAIEVGRKALLEVVGDSCSVCFSKRLECGSAYGPDVLTKRYPCDEPAFLVGVIPV
jgi:hypothetical protein